MPEIQPKVQHLTLFQRTPQWVLPKPDHSIPKIEENFFRLPFTLNAWRKMLYGGFETFGIGFRKPALLRQIQKLGEAHIRLAIKDPALRAKLTPAYTLGCKRIMISNRYYPTFNRDNVELFTEGVKEVRENSIVFTDGSEREMDCLILGTGFIVDPRIYMKDFPITGLDGRKLQDDWADASEAYLGITVHGFPNLFMLYGPNTNLGHNSIIYMLESQIHYVQQCLAEMDEQKLHSLEVRESVQARFNDNVQRKISDTVWDKGCHSWYKTESGKNTNNWPGFTFDYRRQTQHLELSDYEYKAL